MDPRVVRAIAGKELRGWLSNPTGYVFLTLFIAATGAAAFLQDEFFVRNLADLALLNRAMPALLMLFVPALTMNLWSEERRTGTEELLLTLPIRDVEVVLGKYLGALGILTIALAFSTAHLVVLRVLGQPDPGLMLATYLGYWLIGALFVGVGLLGSTFSPSATVAFIMGALGCAALVAADLTPWAGGLVGLLSLGLLGGTVGLGLTATRTGAAMGATLGAVVGLGLWLVGPGPAFVDVFAQLGVASHFAPFGQGLVRLADIVFFLGGACVFVYVAHLLLGRRRW